MTNPNTLCYLLIAVLATGYLFFEGFNLGVGILLPWLGRNASDRSVMLQSIRPFWSRNDLWLLAIGGLMMLAFPHAATAFRSRFSLLLSLLILALGLRAIAVEWRSHRWGDLYQQLLDWLIFAGSLAPAMILGAAITRATQGLPIGPGHTLLSHVHGPFSPLALLGSVVGALMFALHGATYLAMHTHGVLGNRAALLARHIWLAAVTLFASFSALGYNSTRLFSGDGFAVHFVHALVILSYLSILPFLLMRRHGRAFAASSLTIMLATAVIFLGLFPRWVPSTLTAGWDLTVYNAAGSAVSLNVSLSLGVLLVAAIAFYLVRNCRSFHARLVRESDVPKRERSG